MAQILILGGTGEARELARRLTSRNDVSVTLSLAGRTASPAPQAGRVRVGGFGGSEGLARFLRQEGIDVLVDATHPFAARISANAIIATNEAGVPLIVLRRPAWEPVEGDRWIEAADVREAVGKLGSAPRTVFLAIGRQEAGLFAAAPQHRYLVRSVERVEAELPNAEYILDRGPFDAEAERALLQSRRVEIVVAKNSGGPATYGKIAAARHLGLPVIMVARPSAGGAPAATVEDAMAAALHAGGLVAERGE